MLINHPLDIMKVIIRQQSFISITIIFSPITSPP